MNFIAHLKSSIKKHSEKNAFFIGATFYSYTDFAIEISKIRRYIANHVDDSEKLIGLVTNDDLQTYASIIALWFEGKAYVPINPASPIERNIQIFDITEVKTVIDSSEEPLYNTYHIIPSKKLQGIEVDLDYKEINSESLAYILFTSGSTGHPKGVPITFNNLESLVDAINAEPEFNLKPSDRCLQMFELTFDFSVVTYLFPLLAGSCIYTIPKHAIKYFYIFKLINEQKLTVLTMVPSILNYLRPYFSEINAPHVRYCSFGGGALHDIIAKEWSACLPNGKIFNYYGPTEFTVYSGFYPYHKDTHTKALNGIIAIGTPQKNTKYLIVNENNKEVPIDSVGELCLAGPQITPGYWKNEEKNSTSFFYYETDGGSDRYYKTGDLCLKDSDGDYLYSGRVDFQVKIRGYRVELAEVEYHAKTKLKKKTSVIAIDITNALGNSELGLAIEGDAFNTDYIMDYMKTKMADYMMPRHICFIKEFPHSINGKIDRNKLRTHFKSLNKA